MINEEYVVVSEYLDEFLGVDIIMYWDCLYSENSIFCILFGNVLFVNEGLFKDKV